MKIIQYVLKCSVYHNRSVRIEELERRIKQHTNSMHERRKQPKGTPQQEMEAAKRELEIVSFLAVNPLLSFTL